MPAFQAVVLRIDRLHAITQRLGHNTNVGFRVPLTIVDDDGICLTSHLATISGLHLVVLTCLS